MRAEAREKSRKDLGKIQNRVNYLKNAHLVHASSACCSSARDTLVKRVKKPPKEPCIKPGKPSERFFVCIMFAFFLLHFRFCSSSVRF